MHKWLIEGRVTTMDPRKHQKKREKKKKARLQKKKRARQGFFGGPLVIKTPLGQAKMSEVLEVLIEPYSEYWRNEEDLRSFIPLAVLAWNAALLSGSEREEAIQKVLQAVAPEIQSDTRTIIEGLIARKMALFPKITRVVLDYQITMTETGPHLSVVSSLDSV